MSFYGTIYYQITNAFASFFVNNSGKAKATENDFLLADDSSSNLEIAADGRDGFITLDTGNRWIRMKGDAAANTCTFYHSAPDTVKDHWTTFKTFVPVDKNTYDEANEETGTIDLSKNVYLRSRQLSYDKAGHISDNQIK